jgi:5'-3' exonuclease
MGIPSYFSYIVKNHTTLIKKITNTNIKVNNFYLDCNSIIYDCVHGINFATITNSDFDAIIYAVCNKIDEYILLIKPDNKIYIAFDGVAPVAKLDQQRSRRYKSLYQNKISKSIFKDTKADPWNTTAITPGTQFMNKLNEYIMKKYVNISNCGVKIIISASNNYGEGEHKLFQHIRDFPEHANQITVIYGLDADLIMLSINHLPICKQIYLFRETPHFIKSIQVDFEPNESYIIDIPELAKVITIDMNNGEELTNKQQKNRIYDYIFLCFFLGNDFMPHFPSVNIRTGGVDKMLSAYKSTIGNTNENLTDGIIIFWKNVKKLVQYLALQEEENLQKEIKLRNKYDYHNIPNETMEDVWKKFESTPIYNRNLEKFINVSKPGWEKRYYKCLFDVEIDDLRRKQICINYLEGLEWTMKYYTSGCPNWRWSYHYHYPPLLSDLLEHIPYFETEFIKNVSPCPVSELVQLCYVLPKQSLSLLPKKLYDNLVKHHLEWYNSDCEFIWAFCKYFWESHVKLPNIDINELETFIQLNS